MDNIEEIIKIFFWPEHKSYLGCIFTDNSEKQYVLVVSESSVWKSHGLKNKLFWNMVNILEITKEENNKIFNKIVDDFTSVYVIRKRNGEIRYMGKCESIEDIDRNNSKCVMCVC